MTSIIFEGYTTVT